LSSPAIPSRPFSGRALAVLAALTAVLLPAVFLAPQSLAAIGTEAGFSGQRELINTVNAAFVEYWRSGDKEFTPGMHQVVDYWFRFHLIKALLAAVLLVVLIALGVLLWKAFLRVSGLGARAAFASGGVLVTMLALLSLVLVVANVQGTVAPFTSLVSMLPIGAPHGELADTLAQVRQQLADYPRTGNATSPALQIMINDNARYHVAVAVMAATLVVVFIGMSVALWKRFAGSRPSGRRMRAVLGSYGVASALLSLVMIVFTLANITTATDSARGLAGFFGGGS
jgi:hypothetical protein